MVGVTEDDELAAKPVLGRSENTSGALGSHSTLDDRREPDGPPMFIDEPAIEMLVTTPHIYRS